MQHAPSDEPSARLSISTIQNRWCHEAEPASPPTASAGVVVVAVLSAHWSLVRRGTNTNRGVASTTQRESASRCVPVRACTLPNNISTASSARVSLSPPRPISPLSLAPPGSGPLAPRRSNPLRSSASPPYSLSLSRARRHTHTLRLSPRAARGALSGAKKAEESRCRAARVLRSCGSYKPPPARICPRETAALFSTSETPSRNQSIARPIIKSREPLGSWRGFRSTRLDGLRFGSVRFGQWDAEVSDGWDSSALGDDKDRECLW